MARPRKNAAKAETLTADVVGSTLDTERAEEKTGSNVVTLAVCLRCGHKFTDVPNGQGGTKTVYLAGIDDTLRGKMTAILAPAGNCVFQTIAREDWEAIKRMHGRERMFLGMNGHAPCVFEVEGTASTAKKDYKDEIATMATGFEPLDTAAEHVTEANA